VTNLLADRPLVAWPSRRGGSWVAARSEPSTMIDAAASSDLSFSV
jgi:hypothetical protein